MIAEFPAEIRLTANRHADRCGSIAGRSMPTSDALMQAVISRLRQHSDKSDVKQLVDWFTSTTGRQVRKLERQQFDERELSSHTADRDRLQQIRKIYHNTDTGRFIANVAVEIEYAGWRLSGCMQSAASSGDLKRLEFETTRAQLIKGEAETLLSIFEEDTIHSMEFAFSSLTDEQLVEYHHITEKHTALFSLLIDSLLDAIDKQSKQITVSSIP